jgi:hypothetical protein
VFRAGVTPCASAMGQIRGASDSQRSRIQRRLFIIQSPPASIYGVTFPHRFFSREKFDLFMTRLGLVLVVEWIGFDHQANIESTIVVGFTI